MRDQKLPCPYCHRTLGHRGALTRHIQTKHKDQSISDSTLPTPTPVDKAELQAKAVDTAVSMVVDPDPEIDARRQAVITRVAHTHEMVDTLQRDRLERWYDSITTILERGANPVEDAPPIEPVVLTEAIKFVKDVTLRYNPQLADVPLSKVPKHCLLYTSPSPRDS